MATFPGGASVNTLSEALIQDANLKGVFWSRLLELSANTNDDFSRLEGAQGSLKPIWKKTDLKKGGGDIVTFTTFGDIAGPGVRGETALTGNTSTLSFGTYTCQVDFWRDGVEITKKQQHFLAAGGNLVATIVSLLGKKLGRKRMYDMMIKLLRVADSKKVNILRPNNRQTRDEIRTTDVLTPTFLVEAQARLKTKGARPVALELSTSGSPVLHHLLFVGQDAFADIRNSTAYQNALHHAASRGDANPLFSGKVVPWNGLHIWEHVIVDPDVEDAIGSPMLPKATLGVAITAGTAAIKIQGTSDVSSRAEFFGFFPGFDYQWAEGQTPVTDTNTYYVWIVNPPDASVDPGKAGFYSYTGSSGNDGHELTITNRLASAAAGVAVDKLGEVEWDSSVHTDTHPIGSTVIYANKWGTPIAFNFVFGAGAALRAYGKIEKKDLTEKRDYGFVDGYGVESIFGQTPTVDTKKEPRNYLVLESAVEPTGVSVPAVEPSA